MSDEFKTTEPSKKLMNTLGKSFEDAAFDQTDEFVNAGQTVREATSIVAYLMVHAAWVTAGCGAISENHVPDKDKFRALVEMVLDRVEFRDPNEPEPSKATA